MRIIIFYASLAEFFTSWCTMVANNDIFTFVCGVITVIGFVITIYISVKTKSIHKRIHQYKSAQIFNKRRKQYISTLKGYQNAIFADDVDIHNNKMNLLNDINIIGEAFDDILPFKHKILLWRLRRELEREKIISKNKVCNLISKIIAFLSKEKENNNE